MDDGGIAHENPLPPWRLQRGQAKLLSPYLLACCEFVNADEIARGLSPFRPELVSIQAGQLMLAQLQGLLAA